ncbi:Zn-dependent hydrolase [Candidatus Woesearchaeota archaeon]|jgi:glyoxylase-like metal-dependent hydrolase (beta-lactamase superfamily II)|nr:Zn-dependent hydrolase [Candidatus Woesearchaeota archaeon]|tara:strand:+ start:1060 stop:1683 length:624 start_codon:yes stop_codon:yes gene_type:complete
MIFEQIAVGQMQNFSYLIGDEESKEAAVVDPAWENDKILSIAKKHDLDIKMILVTHTDYDHISGVKDMVNATDATVYAHKEGEEGIKNLGISKIQAIDEGSEIDIGKLKVKVLYTPGHNPTQCCFLLDNKLITGDTLFVEGCGRVDMPGGDIKKQWESLQRLKKLDENIGVYPGHDYGSMPNSTIKHEKENNPYMRCDSFEEFSTIR